MKNFCKSAGSSSQTELFSPDGRVTDDLCVGRFTTKLKFCAVIISRKVTNILEVLKLEAQVRFFPPEQDRIHLSNGTLLLNGTFTEGRPAIVRSRLPVAYNPDATAPVIWLNFLDGLLYAEDIPTLQEFIGYCLIPSNKGQRMMVIKGNGGEGKSQIGAVLSTIFGTNMKDGSIGKFQSASPVPIWNILLAYVDDVRWAPDQLCKIHCHRTGQDGFGTQRQAELSGLDISPDCWRSAAVVCKPCMTAATAFTADACTDYQESPWAEPTIPTLLRR